MKLLKAILTAPLVLLVGLFFGLLSVTILVVFAIEEHLNGEPENGD